MARTPRRGFRSFPRAAASDEVVCEEKHMGSRASDSALPHAVDARRRDLVLRAKKPVRSGPVPAAPSSAIEPRPKALLARAAFSGRRRRPVGGARDRLGCCSTPRSCRGPPRPAALSKASMRPSPRRLAPVSRQPRKPSLAPATRGLEIAAVRDRFADRARRAALYAKAWAPYVWPVSDIGDLRVAPFHLLASEGKVRFDRSRLAHEFRRPHGGRRR